MSTQAIARPPESPAVNISPLQAFLWSVRREIWENRGVYLVPLGVGVLIVLATAINVMRLAPQWHMTELDPMVQHPAVEAPFIFASLLLMFSTMVVGIFYSIDALYGERRDRSVLFWKSMPVSDTTAVLAKLSIPVLVLPLVTFAVTVVTQLIMLLLGMMRAGSGLWSDLGLTAMWGTELFHLVAFHGFWWAPFWGWFLLASAYARRAPLLWAVLPPLVIGFGEVIAFRSTHFAHWVLFRFGGASSGPPPPYPMSTAMLMSDGALSFITDIHLWTGFALCAVFVALAIYLRKQRGPA